MKRSFVILSYFFRANLADSFSPPFPELFDAAAFGQGNLIARDEEIMPQSNRVEDYSAESILTSKETSTSLETHLTQPRSDIQSIQAGNDQPSTSNDQSSPLEPSGPENVALDTDDLPSIPKLPFSGGSGEMNYGPNMIEQIQQQWQHMFDLDRQPEPECKPRKIPSWHETQLFKTFAMCCGPAPKMTGPGSGNRLRATWRRIECYLCRYLLKALISNIFSITIDHALLITTFAKRL